ncbi:MAG: glycosyltransferase [Patescibacteria group bacterium]
MHVSVNIVTWNDRRYLPDLFASIRSQTYTDYTVRLLDNGSADGETVPYIMQNEPHWLAARSTKNQGSTGGYNQLMRLAMDRYTGDPTKHVMVFANSDTVWHHEMLENLVRALEERPDVDAVQPKVFRAYSERGDIDADSVKSDILDTTGMRVERGWRMLDRGAGEMDQGQYDDKRDVFGPTGSVMMVRASALQDVAINGEMFDSDFFSYREDADFAWRFRRAGHETLFVPTAIAHHYRGLPRNERRSWWRRFTDRRRQRPFFTALSTRNQLFVLLKNLTLGEALRSAPRLLFFEGTRVLAGIFFEPETRRVLWRAPLLLPAMLRKRALVRRNARVPMRELRAYLE